MNKWSSIKKTKVKSSWKAIFGGIGWMDS